MHFLINHSHSSVNKERFEKVKIFMQIAKMKTFEIFMILLPTLFTVARGEPPSSYQQGQGGYGAPGQSQSGGQTFSFDKAYNVPATSSFTEQGYSSPPQRQNIAQSAPQQQRQTFSFTGAATSNQGQGGYSRQQGGQTQGYQNMGQQQSQQSYRSVEDSRPQVQPPQGQQGYSSAPSIQQQNSPAQQSYNFPPQQNYGAPSPQQNNSPAPKPQQNYGTPNQQQGYPSAAPAQKSQQNYQTPSQQQSYSPAQRPGQNYGAPSQQQSYSSPAPKSQPQQNYGSPSSAPNNEQYGPPGYSPSSPIGGSSAQSCPPNDPSKNKEMVLKAYQEVFGDHNLSNVDTYFAQDYIQHNPMAPDGVDGLKQLIKMVPDGPQQIPFMRVAADGDLVWTHTKIKFFGKEFAAVDIFRIECGKIKEHWDVLQDTKLEMPAANSHPFF